MSLAHHKAGIRFLDEPSTVTLAVRCLTRLTYRPTIHSPVASRAVTSAGITGLGGASNSSGNAPVGASHVHIAAHAHVSTAEEIQQAIVRIPIFLFGVKYGTFRLIYISQDVCETKSCITFSTHQCFLLCSFCRLAISVCVCCPVCWVQEWTLLCLAHRRDSCKPWWSCC